MNRRMAFSVAEIIFCETNLKFYPSPAPVH
jgi:hypothetical protein